MIKINLKSYYLKLFRKPEYYHSAFERDVSEEVAFAYKTYEKINKKKPKKVLDFLCSTASHGRKVLKSYDSEIVCYEPEKKFTDYVIKKFSLEQNKDIFINDLSLLKQDDFDVIFFVFDNIAYYDNQSDLIDTLNYLHSLLKKGGILIIQSNAGTDLSHFDYSSLYLNKNMDKDIKYWVKVEWAIDDPAKRDYKKQNYVGKRVTVFDKKSNEIIDQWEDYCLEGVYNKEDMLQLHALSLFSADSKPLFFEDFEMNQYTNDSYETISVFIRG